MRRLLIFLKEPVPGQVKTRLAAEIGADAACHVYRRCVERTLERLSILRGEITLCVEPAEATGCIRAWLGSAWSIQPQRGATLGERLANAIGGTLTESVRQVVVVGTDSPWIDHIRIEQAFSTMARADLVLGPAADGGYYLIGLAQRAPGLFHEMAWSTSQVLDHTLAKAHTLGMSVSLLPEGYDVDRLTDLQRWMEEDPRHGITVPVPTTRGTAPTNEEIAHA